MAKRKKRNAITLVSLLLALIALIGVYFWYDNYKTAKEAEVEEPVTTIDLATIDTAALNSLHVVMQDADLNLVLQDEVWVSEADPERPINQDHVTSMLNAINDINADRIIMENPENLADYGLEAPAATVSVNLADGSVVTIKIGNKAGASEGYYGMVNEDGIVYLLPIEMGTAFQYTDLEMTSVAESPEITAENINYISIDIRDGEYYELKYSDEAKLDNTGSSMYSWEILKPYGSGYMADSSKVSEIQANYTSFNYTGCVDYQADDLSLYGLDQPAATITIGYYVERTEELEEAETDPETGEEITEKTYYDPYEYQVSIGNLTEEGEYYTKIDGSDAVYTIAASTIDPMLTIDVFSLMNPYVLIPNIDAVDHIEANIQGKVYTMDIEYTTTKNDDGEEETTGTYTFEGSEIEEDTFKELYQKIISATYDAECNESVAADSNTPYMTLTFHLFGEQERTLTASYLPYDDSFCLVRKDENNSFFVDKRVIEDIAAAITGFTGTATEE